MIRIRSKEAGFRRCGVAHPAAWTGYPDDHWTPEQLATLQAETMLQVQCGQEAEDAAGCDVDLPCRKLVAILGRLGVTVPKGARKGELEALLDQELTRPASEAAPAQDGAADGGEG